MLRILDLSGSGLIDTGAPVVAGTTFALTTTQLSTRVKEVSQQGYTVLCKFPSSALTLPFGTQIRLTVIAPTDATTVFNNIYVGSPATSGNAWAYAGNQVELKFSTISGVSLLAGASATTDWTTFTPSGSGLIVGFNVGSSGRLAKMSVPNLVSYYKAAVQAAGTTNPGTGFTVAPANTLYSVLSIEVA